MQSKIYSAAVGELAVTKLSKFIKATTLPDLGDWGKMKATEKRGALIKALGESSEARKEFVVFYGDETGSEQDWSEWETADLPSEGSAPDSTPDEAPEIIVGTSTPVEETTALEVVHTLPAAAPQFVEGKFDQMVADVAGLNAEDSDNNLREMEEQLEFQHLRMGVLLSHMQSSELYLTLGYATLRDYIVDRTGMQYRKAMFLLSNANAVKELGIPPAHLKGVSWSALRYIVQVMDKDNYKKWLEAAQNLTHVALIEEIRQAKAEAAGALPKPLAEGEEKPKPQSKLFNLFPDQKASVEAAIEKAKAEGHVESTGAALDLIAASYTGKPPTDSSVSSVMPDTTTEGLINVFSKMNADMGYDGLMVILAAIEVVWPDVDMSVELPTDVEVAAE